jgi:hypothetical protein
MCRFVDIDRDCPQRAVLITPHAAHVLDHEARLGDRGRGLASPSGAWGVSTGKISGTFTCVAPRPRAFALSVASDPGGGRALRFSKAGCSFRRQHLEMRGIII